MIKVTYLLPELKGASGGAKVIYNHSLLLNKINNEISSQVVHLKLKPPLQMILKEFDHSIIY